MIEFKIGEAGSVQFSMVAHAVGAPAPHAAKERAEA